MKNLSFLFIFFVTISYAQDATVALVEFASGLNSPVGIQNAGDSRLFVTQQTGDIRIVNSDGSVNDTPFLSLNVNTNGNERGLLGLAFHPDYATNGFFFVNYTAGNGSTQVSRFSVTDDPDIADPDSELDIINIAQPFSNHNGGCIQFGPDNYLYLGMGDGGSGGDPGNRSQNPQNPLGKMLRLDIDNPSNGNNYGIPSDNPFVGDTTTLDEIWALGVRNPWKFSFDAQTGDLWIADVGQNEIEEINKVAGDAAGLNYGWRCYEGSDPFNTSGCPDESTLTFPFAEYNHSGNGAFKCSVTGGYVYRGSMYPGMQGLYVFGDFCSDELATIDSEGNLVFFDADPGGLSSFGEDVNNELYVAGLQAGKIYRVIDENLSTEDFNTARFSMFPNPAQQEVTFENSATSTSLSTGFAKAETLNLYDLNGKIVKTVDLQDSKTTFSVAQLAAGIYIARIASTSQTLKLVVQ